MARTRKQLARKVCRKERNMRKRKKKVRKRKHITAEKPMVKESGSILRQGQWKTSRSGSNVCYCK